MAEQHQLQTMIYFPTVPAGMPPEMAAWASALQQSIQDHVRTITERVQDLMYSGTLADRPVASGSLRFYFTTDEATPTLYFDNGSWNAV